jgi:phage-related protein
MTTWLCEWCVLSGQPITRKTRPISWVRAALREFEAFPEGARATCLAALTIAAEGGKADIAKPMRGMGSGVFEIALRFKGDAFRVVYAVQFAEEIWVVHAFDKKSTQGTKTPKHEIELINDRLKRLREMLR